MCMKPGNTSAFFITKEYKIYNIEFLEQLNNEINDYTTSNRSNQSVEQEFGCVHVLNKGNHIMDKSDLAIKKISDGQVMWNPGSRYAWLSNEDFSKRVYYQSENYYM